MDISITGKSSPDSETMGITVEVTVDGETIPCTISTEALLLLYPQGGLGTEGNFDSEKKLVEVIRRKIIREGAAGGRMLIQAEDVQQYAPE